MIRKSRPELFQKRLFFGILILLILVLVSCFQKHKEQNNCKEKLRIGLSGHLNYTYCGSKNLFFSNTEKTIKFSARIQNSGSDNMYFELIINNYNGKGIYQFGQGKPAYCQLTGLGGDVDCYESTEGQIIIMNANNEHMIADILVSLSGFNNKRIVQLESAIDY
ncbi:MAG: hypothetical protein Q7J34_08700 [Bacteroidales bacterium]|nr:hypothetical protein [Bacteroidales bacterium]